MNRGKILTLLVATAIGAGTFAGIEAPQKAYAQDISKIVDNNSDKDNNINNKDNDDKTTATTKEEVKTDTSSSIDTSSFNSQPSFTGDHEDGHDVEQKEVVKAKGFAATKVSENYYNFNIPGAEKHTYGTSGNGRPLYYYKIGTGKKVLFMNFGIHGYEDAWSKDGEELTKLAKNLTERIAKDNAANGLNGWSVVIVPSANPDGVLDGWTNNGPGRNQVSKKIDLNRSFPTFFTPQYNARNYTGPEPLAAPEAKALANLVSQFSESSSHMSLVDVHGWLNETIGDPSLGKAFDSNFGISNKLMSKAANGYLISYAHSKGALATLLELPMPSSSASIQNNGYANKLYNSVKSIIKNGDGFEIMNAEGQVYNTNSLNIRITTSTNANIIGSYSGGTKIKILGKVGDWYQVKSSAGYGFVHKDYVKILSNNTNNNNNNNGGGNNVEAPTQYQIGKVANLSTSLNIRKSPSTSASIITSLSKGTEVKVVGTEGEWYKVYSPSFGYGYAHKNYIEIVGNGNNGGNKPETPTEPVKQTGTIINISTSLNVRAGASTSSKIVGTLKNGATINIVGKEGSWYKIQGSPFGTGYVHGDYVRVNGNATPEVPSTPEKPSIPNTPQNPTVTQTGKVVDVSTKLNIRSGAGTNFGIVGSLGANATVNIIGKEGNWYKISHNGTVGYVSADYIRVNGNATPEVPNTPSTPETPQNPTVTQTGKVVDVSTKLNIRSGAGTNFGIVGSLGANATVNIIGKEGNWYKISHNGTVGYVSANYIRVNNNGGNNNNTGSTEKYGKVVNISTKLNIRRSPSTSSSIVGTLSNNTKVVILEKTNGWYKISYNGTVGYVSASYLAEM